MSYFGLHNHTMYSNIRLLDCINRPKALINKARELGLSGIMITDHECLSAHMTVNQYAKKLLAEDPNFTIALGNEIYLTDTRDKGQKYFHFILGAKDKAGYRALKELSTQAWLNSYADRGMERVPTLKSELKEIISKYKGHVIATSACMGGELSTLALNMSNCERVNDQVNAKVYYDQINEFIAFCKDVFVDDFYIECAPSKNKEQKIVNHKLYRIAQAHNIKMVVGTDAHYLRPENRPVHKAYLNSKDGEREIDSFYEYSYLMTEEEVFNLLLESFPLEENAEEIINTILANTNEVKNKIEFFTIEKKQIIPKVTVKEYPITTWDFLGEDYKIISSLLSSSEFQERYWVNECLFALKEKNLWKKEYLERIETEANVIRIIGEQLEDCLFAYFNTFKHYIDLFWECGSTVGPGRGSATGFLSNYLLGITQLDPVRWKLPYWRFLNEARAELPDIDIDLAPSKRPEIFRRIREERGELGLVQVATFGTEGTKSAILSACRGYRSEECPEGIEVDQAQYMSSLIPQERGFLWSIHDVVYGNKDKDRAPVHPFIREMENYPGLLDIIESIEGLVNKRSSHASGVILYGEDPFDTASFMKTPGGDIITCFDLHEAEAAGDTKYDFLVTEISDKIIKCFELLQKDNVVSPTATIRELYETYLHPEIMDSSNTALWEHLSAGDILDVFQFSTTVGLAIAKKLKPQNPMEMTAANAMMRLMSEKGKEPQQDRFVRIQEQGLGVFHKELQRAEFDEEQIAAIHKHCDQYWGCCAIQEQMMELLMDVAGFTLAEANNARKIVGKKQMEKIPELREKVYSSFDNVNSANYFWEWFISPQLGYAFSLNHSLPYSFVGLQSIFLATNFNTIYWNTACLIVNSGAADEENGGTTDFGKIAKAMGDIIDEGVSVSLVDINKSTYTFSPDAENNQILFGLKGILNVGEDIIQETINNRPYISPKDYLQKVKPKKNSMISLIKGGAFDSMLDRKLCMAWYIWETCDKKSRLTLQNMGGLIKYGLLPEDTEERIMARRVYEFNRYLKAVCKYTAQEYKLDERAIEFLISLEKEDLIAAAGTLNIKVWNKVYDNWMNVFRNWIASDKEGILRELNTRIFKEDWDKYATGSLSDWEMEALCFYYHEHPLAILDRDRYGFSDFKQLPEEPVIEKSFVKGSKTINLFKLTKICGTCIAKNKAKGMVTLLTPSGVVTVKFRKEYFAMFDKQISERGADGVKHVCEKSWFGRGNMIVVQGMRSGDSFITKKYQSSGGHQLYKITEVFPNGEIALQTERYQGGFEENGED